MTPTNVLANARLQVGCLGYGSSLVARQRGVDVHRSTLSSVPADEFAIPPPPYQDGSRAGPQVPEHLGWNGNLACAVALDCKLLRRKLCPGHAMTSNRPVSVPG